MPDSLSPEAVEPHLAGRFGRPYLYATECGSTQTMLEDDSPEGAVAVCDFQAAGRGRLGRTWHAPPGTGIHCSIALRPPPGHRPPQLTLVGALAVAEAIETTVDLSVQIKWPNDVMLNRRKVSGLLGELRGELVVLGIGINVNQTREQLPADARQPPGSLRTLTGEAHDRAALLGLVLGRLEHAYDAWRAGGLEALYGELGARDFLRGRRIAVDGAEGTAEGIDPQGRLLVDGRPVSSGEVSYS